MNRYNGEMQRERNQTRETFTFDSNIKLPDIVGMF